MIVNPDIYLNHDRYFKLFKEAKPFEHVVVDDFLSEAFAHSLLDSFGEISMGPGSWHVYDNPLEVKLAFDNVSLMPAQFRKLFMYMQSDEFLRDVIRPMTGYADLESDPHMHGAGIHYYPPTGKLNMHLDYSIHPITGKERRVNLILYLNDCPSGDLVLSPTPTAHADDQSAIARITPRFNRAVLFKTCDISWHGIPEPILTPRLSVAVYYVSDPRDSHEEDSKPTLRHKALYSSGAAAGNEEMMVALCHIRSTRRLTRQDVIESGIQHSFLIEENRGVLHRE